MSALRSSISPESRPFDGQGDADADGEEDVAALDMERPAQVFEQPFGNRHGVFGVLHVFEQHHELVAAEPAEDVVGSQQRAQPLGESDQHLVARRVAEAVVDDLEVVQVEEHDRDR